ncbi:alpha/beta fold hydrolase, partial [Bordetella pertussis]
MGHRRPSGPRRGDIMQEPRLDFVTCASPTGFHRMAYWEWGDPLNDRVLVCVHGLTRTGRDFDHLARRLAGQWRVVCPDVAGRGKSDWLSNPALYAVPQYVSDMATLIARVWPATLAWVGTSMGGLIGLGLAGAATM